MPPRHYDRTKTEKKPVTFLKKKVGPSEKNKVFFFLVSRRNKLYFLLTLRTKQNYVFKVQEKKTFFFLDPPPASFFFLLTRKIIFSDLGPELQVWL